MWCQMYYILLHPLISQLYAVLTCVLILWVVHPLSQLYHILTCVFYLILWDVHPSHTLGCAPLSQLYSVLTRVLYLILWVVHPLSLSYIIYLLVSSISYSGLCTPFPQLYYILTRVLYLILWVVHPYLSVISYTYSCPLSHTLGCAPLISVISYTYSCPLSHTLGCAPHACCSRPPGLSRGTRPGGTCTERACTSGSGWSPGSSTTL